MRFLSRCSVIIALAVTIILYLGWVIPSTRQYTQWQKSWAGGVRRIVTFGDSWSDTGRYILNGPPPGYEPIRHPLSGPVWPEALCAEILCDSIDNYARSLPPQVTQYYTDTVGAVLDNAVFQNATSSHNFTDFALRDLQQQVRDFVKMEGFKRMWPTQPPREWTLFTIWFGLNDIFHYSRLERDVAKFAITKSINHLFRQLNIIAEWMDAPILVVLPKAVNITNLPRFNIETIENTDTTRHRMALELAAFWNEELSSAAAQWKRGHIFLLEADKFIEGQVQAKLAHGAPSVRKRAPEFNDVTSPCKTLVYPSSNDEDGSDQLRFEEHICEDPDSHLFWDDFALSGKAHRMLGMEAGRLVKQRSTYNTYVAQQAVEAVRSSIPPWLKDRVDQFHAKQNSSN
ncbi:uncharacterized protein K452DRAFT_302209 [Aplosporella prunicola CBS 121167]|uniref:Carbohydrate esterase family 16 protein n=1 Tax=Aplosporella prunicola CBS 121167 TaxID=1176127 RepID=A0A6A6B2D2_9PEZI|nr:uncharacterized protein K452DRAFT_302209 [Aplosporella prunicola CBS 121167]KAF2137177.1 hypothetical protein K452DRAFT_302209 [Aplosporella prunicola CBS 121167]